MKTTRNTSSGKRIFGAPSGIVLFVMILFSILGGQKALSQGVGISEISIAPNSSSILELRSTLRGFLAPRMTTTERLAIASPAQGLLVYDTTTQSFWYFEGGWKAIASSTLGTSNQLLGMNAGGTANEYKTLSGTANQINLVFAPGSITLSTPQDIHTGASPTFSGLTLSGLTPNAGVYTDGFSKLTSSIPTSGVIGYWNRTGTVLSPTTIGDAVTTSGNIYTTGGGAITSSGLLTGSLGAIINGGAISLNNSSNFATNINTGTSSGGVTIGNSANNITLPAFTAAGLVHNNAAGVLSTALLSNIDITNGTIDLTTKVTGVLPIANGGTNSGAALSGQSIIVSDGTSIIQGDKGTTTTILHGNAGGAPAYTQVFNADIATGTIDLMSKVTNVLPVVNGGTGQSSYVNGEILIGNSTGNTLTRTTLTGTANQVNVTNGPGSITLSTPQDIHTGASPTFIGLTLSGLSPNAGVYTNGTSGLTSTPPTVGTIGYWDRTGTILSPTTAGDAVTTSGNISTSGAGTITSAGLLTGNAGAAILGGAVDLNNGSNFATNINTGTSTGGVTIGNSANNITLPAFATAGLVHNNATGVLSTGLLSNIDITNGTIDLTAKVTGVLPVANGGTNSGATLAGQSIVISNGSAIVQGDAGTTTTILHGNAGGAPSYSQIFNADIANGTIDLLSKVTNVLPVVNGGTGQSSPLIPGGILYGLTAASAGVTAAGNTGQMLRSTGAGTPIWSTPTYPNSATSGKILRGDGTNWLETTASYPNTTTINQILYSSADNNIIGVPALNNGILVSSSTGVPQWVVMTGFTSSVLVNGHIYVGNVADVATDVPVSGDATIINTGEVTVGRINGATVPVSGALVTGNVLQVNSASSTTYAPVNVGGGVNFVTGILPVDNGGTGVSSLGTHGVVIGQGTNPVTTTSAGISGQVLQSRGGALDPGYSTAIYPATTTTNQLLYSSSNDNVTGLATGNNGVLVTDAGGVPSISSILPDAVQYNITKLGTISNGTWNGAIVDLSHGGTNTDLSAGTAVGDLLYGTATGFARLADAATGNVLISGGTGTAPSWNKVGLTTHVSGVLQTLNGGTGYDNTYTSGQLLIGNAAGSLTRNPLTGTTNQINIANGDGSITLSTPQNIDPGASPTFAGLTLSGLTPNSVVYTDASRALTAVPPSTGIIGFWNRIGTTLTPTFPGDDVTTTGNISTTGTGTVTSAGLLTGNAGATISGGAVNLNSSSPFATNINTGTSTGGVTIGNSANNITLPAFTTAGLVHNNAGGVLSTGLLTNSDVDANAGIDATKISTGNIDNTEFGYLNGVTSAVQTQFNNIQSELDVTQTGAGLNNDGTYTANAGANYISGATSLKMADNLLDAQVKLNADNIALGNTNVANLQTEVNNIETGSGLNADGTYTANGAANYISGATSMISADNMLDAQLKTTNTNLTAETTRATAAEGTLTTNLAGEVTRATGAETTLTTNLGNEVIRATAAEGTLTTNIGNEVTRATAAEGVLTTNLTNEVTRATGAEATLTTNLATETTNRTTADAALQSELDATQTGAGLNNDGTYTANAGANYISGATSLKIADNLLDAQVKLNADNIALGNTNVSNLQTEVNNIETGSGLNADGTYTANAAANYISGATSMISADNMLDAQLKTTNTNLTAEVTRATGAETLLTTNLANEVTRATGAEGTLTTNLGNEVIRATAAEGVLTTNLNNEVTRATGAEATLTTNLATEVTNRTNGDAALQTELDATQTGAGLNANGTYTANGAANYISTATSLKIADNLLDAQVKLNADNIALGNTSVANLQTEVNNIETGSGLNADGTYTANAAANYISGATSMISADNMLDAQLKTTNTNLTAEVTRATGAETLLTTNLANEVTRATGAEGTLTTNLGNEVIRATAAEGVLTTNLNNEVTRATGAEATLTTNLATETTNRTTADAALQSELDATQTGAGLNNDGTYTANAGANYISGATSLKMADNLLDAQVKLNADNIALGNTNVANLQTEVNNIETGSGLNADGTYTANGAANYISGATSMISADNMLDAQLKTTNTNLTAETTRATAAEGTLTTNLAGEVTRATGAETTLTTNLGNEVIRATAAEGTLTTNIGNEVSRATTAEGVLTTNLGNEVTRATAAEGVLTTNLTNEVTRATGAEATLTTNLATETTNRTTADAALQSELDATQTGAGLNNDGTYTANAGANYISGATSLKIADNLLDAQVKLNADNIALGNTNVSNLQTEVNNIETGSGLNADGTYTANGAANYISGATSMISADNILDAQLKTTNTNLTAETTRATAAEGTLTTNLAGEVTRATGAETTLTTNLGNEVTRATAAEGTLTTNLGNEVSRATTAEGVLTTNLGNEVTRATAAEGVLTTNLTNEVTRATGAEATLTTNLGNEVIRATAAEGTLTTNIGNEVTRATAAEGVLTTNLTNEVTRATGAEATLTTNLATETTNRTTADAALQSELDATQTGAGLNANGTYTANGAANYISGATSLKIADNLLDAQAKSNADNIALKANISGQVFTGAITATNLSGTNTGDQTLGGLGGVPTTRTVNGKSLAADITLLLASADYANQGTSTTLLHGNAAGNPSWSQIVNADIDPAAAIAYTKLASLASGNILLGNATGVPTSTAVTGDVTISNTGVTAIGATKVTNAMLAGSIAASKLVGTDIATVGTITAGTWNAGAVTSSGAITGNTIVKSGGLATQFLKADGSVDANTYVTSAGTVTNFTGSLAGDVSGTQGATVIGAGKVTNAMLAGSIAASKLVGTDIATVGTITAGTWNGSVIPGQYGGTGVNNPGKTITLGGNLTTAGAFATTLTVGAATNVTLPASGTLATLAGAEALTNKTYNGNTITNGTGILTIAAGKTLTASDNATVSGTNTGDQTLGGLGGVPTTRTVNGKSLAADITLLLASADYANQGTSTTLLHGNAAGNPSWSQIVNADIDPAAAIAYTKLASLASGNILLGNATGVPTSTAVTGDVTISNTGVTAIGATKVTNAMLAGSIAASKLVGTDIATVGTITAGTWNAGAVTSSGAITGNTIVKSGGLATQFLKADGSVDANTYVTSAGTVTNFTGSLAGDVSGTQGATVIGAGKVTNAMLAGSIAASKLVGTDIATVGIITAGTWNGSVIPGQYGGTGVNNTGKTITLGGNLTTAGAFTTTLTATNNTTLTLPVTGTLATLGGAEALTNKTYNGNSITTGTGILTIAAGKTLTASDNATVSGTNTGDQTLGGLGGVPTTRTVNGKSLAADITLLLASADYANQGTSTTLLHGNAAGNPSWSQIVNADIDPAAAIAYSKLASLASGNILLGNATGVPTSTAVTGDVTISNTGVTAIGATKVTNAMLAGSIASSKLVGTDIATVGTITAGTWNGSVIPGQYGGTGVNNTGKTITLGGNLTTAGAFTTTLTATNNTTLTLPVTGTLATLGGAEALTNKTYNGNSITTGTGILTIAAGKTLTASDNATVSGTNTGDQTLGGLGGVPTTRTVNGKSLAADITLLLASADYANQGTSTTLLHGNAAGNPSWSQIVNADIDPAATIAYSKLASLASGNILLGNATGVPTSTAVTGDVTISNTGVTAIGATKVTNAMLAGSIASSKLVGTDIATVGTITAGTWNGNVILGQYGGTGVNNTGKTITLGGNLTTAGAFTTTLTATNNTTLTLPVTGTLATLGGAEALTNKTYNGNSITTGTGILTIAAGKTLTASDNATVSGTNTGDQTLGGLGGVPTTRTVNGKSLAADITLLLASADYANQGTSTTLLHGNAAGNPSWSQIVNADIDPAATIAYSKLASLASGNILLGNATGVPTSTAVTGDVTISNTGVTAIGATKVTNAMLAGSIASSKLVGTDIATVGTITAGTWNGNVILGQYGGTGVNNTGKTITLGGNLTTAGAFATTLTVGAATNVTLPASGTLATTGNLSQFAATTSAQLATLISDETGTAGSVVFSNAPTFAGLSSSGATVNLNAGSNNITNINTGTSTGAVNIANGGTGGNAISIGNALLGTSIVERVGTGDYSLDGAATSNYRIGAATVGGTINIGGTAQTGTITLGNSTAAEIVNIANGSGAATVNIATGNVAGNITIGDNSGAPAGTIKLNGATTINGALNYGLDSGGTDAYVVNVSPAPTAYTAGFIVLLQPNTTNNLGATINVNGLGVRNIYRPNGAVLTSGDLTGGGIYILVYNGTEFRLIR